MNIFSEAWNALLTLLGSSLSFFYDIIPSSGFAIISLTIVINILVFPLTLKQTRATRAFQSIQPEIRRLQKEYKDRPQELQQEMVKLQRETGATPGGCLVPLLVQMPIWFALFRVLRPETDAETGEVSFPFIPDGSAFDMAIEAGEASFLGMDIAVTPSAVVSSGDYVAAIPYIVMLLIMMGSQYLQQWHAQPRGQGQDGANPQQRSQQLVTRIMPLFFGFISYNFPAGLILYWTTSNLFRLGQQALIFRIDGRPETAKKDPDTEENNPAPKPQPGAANKKRRRRRK